MKVSQVFILSAALLAGSLGLACKATANAASAVATTENTTVEAVEVDQTPQKDGNGGGTEPECQNPLGADSAETRKNVSLYREQFQNKKYVDALPFWRYAYQNAPCFKEYITADGAYLMTVMISKTNPKETATIKAYADTLMQVYDTRLRLFGRNGNVVGRKGRDMFKYYPEKAMDAIALLRESIELEGNKSAEMVIFDLMSATVQQNKNGGAIADDEVINWFDKLSAIIDYNLKEKRTQYNDPATKDTARTGQAMRLWEWVEVAVVDLGSPYLTCEKLTQLYQPKFKATPEDPALVEKIITLLKRAPNCAKTDFYLDVAEQNFKLSPSAAAAAALAKAFQEKGNSAKSKSYYEKAAELETDKLAKADYYVMLASLELSTNDCSSARTYARKALENNPKSGEAYMVIGNAYMACAGGCGAGKVESQYPYLAAYDKFVQAKNVDPSIADKANSRMAIAAARWPVREDVFFENKTEGATVNTGCWIGETTTLRVRQ